ncbi:hypothetical protein [Paenibacillus radicis (ex Xue et al. 2023)]|uniref:Uncharacterized protein n=1 Tax=Paenibacillus radicis (ex Xue et al. 2023) TaxID=2972489 RepID=A0ABT1YQZ7_9BACL|nr:hypothetical protein [Paenibacillus radicis (ex Xue et al. 2023)]MCR8634708.1 hypothetical protein [Paenibacillus radicis (ex Xue et al. 2023)]
MSIARWNLKEAGGKIPTRGTRTTSGTGYGTSLLNKTKSNKLHGHTSVNGAGAWKESESSYRGRSHGREEIRFESRLKQDLS